MSRYRVCCVCMGNICRSPMAEAVLRRRLAAAGLDGLVVVDSAGTGDWHVGDDADPRARSALSTAGYPLVHSARVFDATWFAHRDLVLAMDRANLRALTRLAPDGDARSRLRLMRSFDPAAVAAGDVEVPDPYYGGADGFNEVLSMLERAADGVVDHVRAEFSAGG